MGKWHLGGEFCAAGIRGFSVDHVIHFMTVNPRLFIDFALTESENPETQDFGLVVPLVTSYFVDL